MDEATIPYKKHILVCINEKKDKPCCAEKQSMELVLALKSVIEGKNLTGIIRVNKTGCLGKCGFGANIMIYPDGTWLKGVTKDDIPSIIEKHIMPFVNQ